jgi:hypothetical protein
MRITVFGATRPHRTLHPRRGTAPRSPAHRLHPLAGSPGRPVDTRGRRMDDGRDLHTVRKAIDGAGAVISTVSAERRKGPNHVAEVSR